MIDLCAYICIQNTIYLPFAYNTWGKPLQQWSETEEVRRGLSRDHMQGSSCSWVFHPICREIPRLPRLHLAQQPPRCAAYPACRDMLSLMDLDQIRILKIISTCFTGEQVSGCSFPCRFQDYKLKKPRQLLAALSLLQTYNFLGWASSWSPGESSSSSDIAFPCTC